MKGCVLYKRPAGQRNMNRGGDYTRGADYFKRGDGREPYQDLREVRVRRIIVVERLPLQERGEG